MGVSSTVPKFACPVSSLLGGFYSSLRELHGVTLTVNNTDYIIVDDYQDGTGQVVLKLKLAS